MRKVFLFMMVSLDGYFEGENHDITWHTVDNDFNDFAIKQTGEVSTMLFGRRTYELMESYWPTEDALKDDPTIAKLMNETPKVVFSKTLKKVNESGNWKNITLYNDGLLEEVARLKDEEGEPIAIFGSNTLMVQLADAGLIDEFRIIIAPLALGKGTPLFAGLKSKLQLQLLSKREFKNGNILLTYKPSEKTNVLV